MNVEHLRAQLSWTSELDLWLAANLLQAYYLVLLLEEVLQLKHRHLLLFNMSAHHPKTHIRSHCLT